MSKNKIITIDQKKRIQDLAIKGLSTKEIARIMNISEKSVIRNKLRRTNTSRVRLSKQDFKRDDIDGHIKNNESVKRNRKRRLGDSSVDINKKRTKLPESKPEDNATTGEEKELENMVFVGGKKNMPKNKEEKNPESDEKTLYRCYNCHYYQETIFTECPKCGTKNIFEE